MCRIRRVREEVERVVVWRSASQRAPGTGQSIIDNTVFCSDSERSKLEMKSYFNLRMTSFFSPLFRHSEGVFREIADIIRGGVVEELHIRRICSAVFR